MTENEALLAIQELMDGVEWTPDTLESIASILESAGYRVRDMDDDMIADKMTNRVLSGEFGRHD